ncbi:MAG: hypothetical protein ACOC10_07295 [Bacteroidota bacterium]
MDPVFKKLNYKGQSKVWVLNAPASFIPALDTLAGEVEVMRHPVPEDKADFAIVFAAMKAELEELIKQVVPALEKDAVFWVCYPKGTSKKYRCDFNRDTGWELLGEYDMEPVRQVAIDEDWSALRFRNVGDIKKITRSAKMALSKEGKQRGRKRF